jgi:hypothetical protein
VLGAKNGLGSAELQIKKLSRVTRKPAIPWRGEKIAKACPVGSWAGNQMGNIEPILAASLAAAVNARAYLVIGTTQWYLSGQNPKTKFLSIVWPKKP